MSFFAGNLFLTLKSLFPQVQPLALTTSLHSVTTSVINVEMDFVKHYSSGGNCAYCTYSMEQRPS